MNRTHRSLWNSALGAWVAAPENAHARGKRSRSALRTAKACAVTAAMWCAVLPAAHACSAGDTDQLAACIAGNDSFINLTASIILTRNLPVLSRDVTINGGSNQNQTFTLDGDGKFRGFFIGAGTTTVNNLTMQNLRAQGGQGGSDGRAGGGGLGAGAAVFVMNNAGADLNNVRIIDSRAIGGNGGAWITVLGAGNGGGGGGMGGNGGGFVSGAPGVGRGGGGLFEDGGVGTAGANVLAHIGGNGGGPNGGAGGTPGDPGGNGGDGGLYSGGGGAGNPAFEELPRQGGTGGFGGGGGGGSALRGISSQGGNGGFGGGGGAGVNAAGAGGFGGGGGGNVGIDADHAGAVGGFGGGKGVLGGGGGAGMGGAIFVMDEGSLTLSGSTEVSNNHVDGGVRGFALAQDGLAFGAGIFMQGARSTLAFAPAAGSTQTMADVIADQTGSGGTGDNAGTIGLTKRGGGRLVLSADNAYSGATTVVGGTLSISSDRNLGSALTLAALTLDGGTLQATETFTTARSISIGGGGGGFQTDGDLTSTGVISGAGGVTKTGAGSLTLAGANSYQGGTRFVESVVAVSSDANLGDTAGGLVFDGGTLRTTANVTTNRATTLMGNGTIQTDGDTTLTHQGLIGGPGALIKDGRGTLVLTGANTHRGTIIGLGTLSVSADENLGEALSPLNVESGTLRITSPFATSRPIVAGTFRTDADFVASGAIGGRLLVKTGAGTLTLEGNNTYAGTLISEGVVSVSSNANLGGGTTGFTLNGGTLRTTASFVTPRGARLLALGGTIDTLAGTALTQQGAIDGAGGLVKFGAGTLTLTGTNTYEGGTTLNAGTLAGSATSFGSGPIANNGALLMQQPVDATFANTITGSGSLAKTGAGLLTLTGRNSYGGGSTISEGALAGNAGSFGSGDIANNAALRIDQPVDATLVNIVTGSGTLTKTGAGTLMLAGANLYTGGTTVSAGTLAGNAVSFGSGAIANNAALLIDQPVDAILANSVTGSGVVTKTGAGTLTLNGENSYSGGTDLKQGGLAVGNSSALGTGELAMHEGTTLRFAADGLALNNPVAFTEAVDPTIDTGAFTATLAGAISGPGDLSKIGSGTLVLSGANTYTGATAVSEGTLRAGAINTFSSASAHGVAAGATLDLGGFNQSIAGLSNAGTVSLVSAAPGTTLTVTGPYVGNAGLLRLGTLLGDSASASDRLILSGPAAIASGRTTVQVVNLGGLGALTTGNGIELISGLNGATTTAQTTGDAFALQGGHVDAGAYEYRLQAGDAPGGGENWYLRSTSTLVIPPVFPVPPAAPEPPAPLEPSSPPAIQVPTYRAEVPLFAALPEQLRQGNLAMLANLHQRIGDDDMKTAAGAPGTAAPSSGERRAWGRVLSTRQTIRQSGTVSPQSEGSLSGLQAGTDLWSNPAWRAGLYVGQLDGDMQVSGFARGVNNLAVGSNDLRSQYLGGYATYSDPSGFYVDGVLQAGRHRYEVEPQATLRTKGKASSLSASLELGQAFALGQGWQIEPQAQLVYQRLNLDDVAIAGARVQQDRDGSWLARLGVRVKGDIATAAGRLQPYARVNLYRASSGNDNTRFISPAASTAIASSRGGSSTELAAGFTLAINDTTSLYGELGKLWASGGDTRVKSQVNASAGLKVRW